MSKTPKEQALRGRALRAAVRAAEAPGLGAIMRQGFFKELGMGALFEVDLRGVTGRTALLPFVEGRGAAAPPSDTQKGGDK